MILWKRIGYGTSSVDLATPKIPFVVLRKFIHVTTAFNAGGSNNISFGYTASKQAYGTNTGVGTTGWKTITDGTETGYVTVGQTIAAFYVQTGAAATAGSAIIGIEIEPSAA